MKFSEHGKRTTITTIKFSEQGKCTTRINASPRTAPALELYAVKNQMPSKIPNLKGHIRSTALNRTFASF